MHSHTQDTEADPSSLNFSLMVLFPVFIRVKFVMFAVCPHGESTEDIDTVLAYIFCVCT